MEDLAVTPPSEGVAPASCSNYILPHELPSPSFALIWNNTCAIALLATVVTALLPRLSEPVSIMVLGGFLRDRLRRALQNKNAEFTEPQATYLLALLKPGVEHGLLFAAIQLCTVLLEKLSSVTYFWNVPRPHVGFISGWLSGLGLLAIYASGVLLHYGSTIGLLLYSLHGVGVAIGLAIYIFTTVLYYVGTGPAGAFCSLVELVLLLLRQIASSPMFALRIVAFGAFTAVAPLFTSIVVFRRRGERGDWAGLGWALATCLALNAAIVTLSSTMGFRLSVELTAASRGTSLCSCGQEPSMAGWLRGSLTVALFAFVGLIGYPFLQAARMLARKTSLLRYHWNANSIFEREFRERHVRWRIPAQWRALWRRLQLLSATASSALGWLATAARYAFGVAAAFARDDPEAAAGMNGLLGSITALVNGLVEELGATAMTAIQYAMQMINLMNHAGDAARAAARTLNSRSLAFDVAAYPIFARDESVIVDCVPEPDFTGVELRLVSYTNRTALGGTLPLPRALWHRRPLASLQLSSGSSFIPARDAASAPEEPIIYDGLPFPRSERLPVYASCRVYMAAVSRLLRRMEQRAEVPPALQMAGLWRAYLNEVRGEGGSGGAAAAAAAAEEDAAVAEAAAATGAADDFLGLPPDAAHWFFHQPVDGAGAVGAGAGAASGAGAGAGARGGVGAGMLVHAAAAGLQAGHGPVADIARADADAELAAEAARREETRAFPPLPDDSSVAAEDDDRDAWEVDADDVLHGDWTAALAVEADAAAEAEAGTARQRIRNTAAAAARAAVTFSNGVASRAANTAADRAVGLQWAGERAVALARGLYDSAATAVANAAAGGLAGGGDAEEVGGGGGAASWWRPFGESAAAALSAARGDFRGILTHMTHTASSGMQWLLGTPALAGAGAGAHGAGYERDVGCLGRLLQAVKRSTVFQVLAYCGCIPARWADRRGAAAAAAARRRRGFTAPVMDAMRGLLRWDADGAGSGTGVFMELELVLSDRESIPLDGPAARGIVGAATFTGGSVKLRFPLVGYSSAGGWHGALLTDRVLRSVLGRVVEAVDSRRRHIMVGLFAPPLLARQPSPPRRLQHVAAAAAAASGSTDASALIRACMQSALMTPAVAEPFRVLFGCAPSAGADGQTNTEQLHNRIVEAAVAGGVPQHAGIGAGAAGGADAGGVNPQEAGAAAFVLWQLHRCSAVPTAFEDNLRAAARRPGGSGVTHQVLLRTALSQFEPALSPLLRLYAAESDLMAALTVALEEQLRARQATPPSACAAGATAAAATAAAAYGGVGAGAGAASVPLPFAAAFASASASTQTQSQAGASAHSLSETIAGVSVHATPVAQPATAEHGVGDSDSAASSSSASAAALAASPHRAEVAVGTADDADEIVAAGTGVRAVTARLRRGVSRAARAAASLPADALEALGDWRAAHGLWSVALAEFLQRFAVAYVEAAARARRYGEEAAAGGTRGRPQEGDQEAPAAAAAAAGSPTARGRWAGGGPMAPRGVNGADAAHVARAGGVGGEFGVARRRHGAAGEPIAVAEPLADAAAAAAGDAPAAAPAAAPVAFEPPRRVDDITGPELLARLICLASAAAVAAVMRQ